MRGEFPFLCSIEKLSVVGVSGQVLRGVRAPSPKWRCNGRRSWRDFVLYLGHWNQKELFESESKAFGFEHMVEFGFTECYSVRLTYRYQ